MLKFRSNSVRITERKSSQDVGNFRQGSVSFINETSQGNLPTSSMRKASDDGSKSDSEVLSSDTMKRAKSCKAKLRYQHSVDSFHENTLVQPLPKPIPCKAFLSGGKSVHFITLCHSESRTSN